MGISVDAIKELRSLSSASIAECKRVLEESGGDIKKAMELLRKRGLEMFAKKQDSQVKEGRIEAYVHLGNKIGVLLEVGCQTDFVARNEAFAEFSKDITMQIAAANPLYIKREDVPANIIEQEEDKELYFKNNCLLEQAFIKDPGIAVKDYLGNLIAKFSENIVIRRFVRYEIGE